MSFHSCLELSPVKEDLKKNWKWAPEAFCISLKEREDRTRDAIKQFNKVGLQNKITFYRPLKDTSTSTTRKSIRGCWESHRAIASLAYEKNMSAVLIFEDDVLFGSITPEVLKTLKKAYQSLPPTWNVFFLGHWNVISRPTENVNVNKVNSLCLHAYILNRPMMKWIADHPFDKYAKNIFDNQIDVHIMWQPECYAFKPMICFQSGSESDSTRAKDGIVTLALSKSWMERSEEISPFVTKISDSLFLVMIIFITTYIVRFLNNPTNKK